MDFQFLPTDMLRSGEIYLKAETLYPADDAKGYVPMYHFGIHHAQTGQRMGHISLRIGDNENTYYGGNIGYGVDAPYRGNHYAEKACYLAFTLARAHGMKTLLITCNPENAPSRRTCERVGGRLLEIADLPEHNEMYQAGERTKCIFEVTL